MEDWTIGLNLFKIAIETKESLEGWGGVQRCTNGGSILPWLLNRVHPGARSTNFDSIKGDKGEVRSSQIIDGDISPHSHINKALVEILFISIIMQYCFFIIPNIITKSPANLLSS